MSMWHSKSQLQRSGLVEPRNVAQQNTCHRNSEKGVVGWKRMNNPQGCI